MKAETYLKKAKHLRHQELFLQRKYEENLHNPMKRKEIEEKQKKLYEKIHRYEDKFLFNKIDKKTISNYFRYIKILKKQFEEGQKDWGIVNLEDMENSEF